MLQQRRYHNTSIIENKWVAIVRYDMAHGYFQRDVMKPNGEKEKTAIEISGLKEASIFLPVTKDLGETVKNNFVPIPYQVIPNVVNMDLFYYKMFTPEKFRFIHIPEILIKSRIHAQQDTVKLRNIAINECNDISLHFIKSISTKEIKDAYPKPVPNYYFDFAKSMLQGRVLVKSACRN